jgi:membrane protein DedA with SNARE-associated domain
VRTIPLQRCGSSPPTRSRRGSTFSSRALTLAPLALAHHQVQGPPIGYAAVGLAAAIGWFGVPGPGEAALIAAAVFAAEHRLDIWMVVAVAAVGAATGGIAGWLVGMKASRPVLTGPGPLRRTRRRLIARGERFFEHHGPIGVFLAPSWAAGVHNMRASRFLPLNAVAAIAWALVYGGAAFLLGADVANGLESAGAVVPVAVVALVILVLAIRRIRRPGQLLPNRKTSLREG